MEAEQVGGKCHNAKYRLSIIFVVHRDTQLIKLHTIKTTYMTIIEIHPSLLT